MINQAFKSALAQLARPWWQLHYPALPMLVRLRPLEGHLHALRAEGKVLRRELRQLRSPDTTRVPHDQQHSILHVAHRL